MQNCQDAYFATFPSFAELFGYQKQVNDRSTWTHCAVNQLHVEPLNRNSSCYPALKEFAPGVSQEAVEDSFNNLGLAIRFDQKLYPALPTVELPKKCEPSLRKILAIQRDIDACQREIKRYEEEVKAHTVRIAELMKEHEHGVLETTTDKLLIDFVSKTTKRADSTALKKKYPLIYDEVLNTSVSRKLKVSAQPK